MTAALAVLAAAYLAFGLAVALVGSTKLMRMGEPPFDGAEFAAVVLFWPYIIISSILED